jgi:hypothetical protein
VRKLPRILFNVTAILSALLTLAAIAAFIECHLSDGQPWRRGGWGTTNAPWRRLTLEHDRVTLESYRPGTSEHPRAVSWQRAGIRYDNADSMVPIASATFPVSYHQGWRLTVPLWMLLASSLVIPAARLGYARWEHTRPRPGCCPTCGYDLRATPHRCPECGAIPAH